MAADWNNQLVTTARSIAALESEDFGTQHFYGAMDVFLAGPAYTADMTVAEKLESLARRAAVYLKFDRFLVAHGQPGTLDTDSPRKRIATFDEHIADILRPCTSDRERRDAFLRFMCRIHGLFLGREVLNRDFTFYTHAPLFDFFVQKDPFKSIEELDRVKNRLCLMPRGSFKSVADGVDCAQWIVNFPNVRIVLLTSTLPLAKSFVGEIKNYFTADDLQNPETFTPFQALFAAENFLLTDQGKEIEFICPARSRGDARKKDATIRAGSVGGGKVGLHCEVIKLDDAVDEKNTETSELTAKTIRKIGQALKLVDPSCYRESYGTPYSPGDWYNHLRTQVENVLSLIRPAKVLRKGLDGSTAVENGKLLKDLRQTDWSLLFPFDKNGKAKLSHEFLRGAQKEDPEGFPSQYMLDAHGYKPTTFSEEVLQRQIIPQDRMPIDKTQKYLLVDTAETDEWYSDYSVIATLEVDRSQNGYITDMVRGKLSLRDLVYQIAQQNHVHKPVRIVIEDARGASKMRNDIIRAAADMGDLEIPLDFVQISNKKDAKAIRIGKLESKLQDRRLFFLNTLPYLEDLLEEFKNFGHWKHDDIPDCIGYSELVLSEKRPGPEDPYREEMARRILQNKAFDDMIYGSPEGFIVDVPIQPLPDTGGEGTGDNSGEELFNPFGVPSFQQRRQ